VIAPIRVIKEYDRYRLVERSNERFVQCLEMGSYLRLCYPELPPCNDAAALVIFNDWLRKELGLSKPTHQEVIQPVAVARPTHQLVYPRERDFQQAVIDFAVALGWDYYHTFDSRRSNPGFLDLVLWRDRQVEAEVKLQKKQPTAEQCMRLEWLQTHGHEGYLWFPQDWEEIEGVLSRKVSDIPADNQGAAARKGLRRTSTTCLNVREERSESK
jgi:hypothetical protein